MSTNTNKALTLFQLTQPSFEGLLGFKQTERINNENDVVGLTLTVEGISDTAKRLGVTRKDPKVADARIALTNKIKEVGVSEAIKMLADPGWTGANIKSTVNQKGIKRFALALISVPDSRAISRENMAKELAKMSEDEQTAIMEEAEAIKAGKKVIEIES
jgi:hypothetical protein